MQTSPLAPAAAPSATQSGQVEPTAAQEDYYQKLGEFLVLPFKF